MSDSYVFHVIFPMEVPSYLLKMGLGKGVFIELIICLSETRHNS